MTNSTRAASDSFGTDRSVRSLLSVMSLRFAALAAAMLFVNGHWLGAQETESGLPRIQDMQVPSMADLLTKQPIDWIVIKGPSNTEEVLLSHPVYPRPGALEKKQKEFDELSSASTRPKRMDGETQSEYRDRIEMLRDEARHLTIEIPEQAGSADDENVEAAAEYRIATNKITRIIYHEDQMLMRADKLLNEGNLPKAFELLLIVERQASDWPGYSLRRNRLVFEEAKLRLKNDQLEEALAFFEELHGLEPNYGGLSEQMGLAVDNLINRATQSGDLRRARYYLLRLQKLNPAHPVVQTRVKSFEQQTEDLLDKARKARSDGNHRDAVDFAAQAARVWPPHPALRNSFRTMASRYQVLSVGVLRFADEPTPFPLPTAADRRREALLSTKLFDLRRFERAAFYESRYFEEWVPTDLGRQIVFKLRPRRASWETNPTLTSQQVVRAIGERLRPDSVWYDERLATFVRSLEVHSPYEFTVNFSTVPVRPQALFRFPVRAISQRTGTPAEGESPADANDSLSGLLSKRFQVAEANDSEMIYQRVIPQSDQLSQYRVAEIVEKKYETFEKAVQGLLQGEISVMPHVPTWLIDRFEQDDRFFVEKYAVPTTHVLQFNPASASMKNAELRRAMANVLDRQQIVQDVILHAPLPEPLRIDEQRARLVSGVFPVTSYAYDVQTVRRSRDLPLAFPLMTFSQKRFNGEVPELVMICEPDQLIREAATKIVEQWGRMGVKVKLLADTDAQPEKWDIVYRTVRMAEPVTELWPFLTMKSAARVEDLEHLPDWLRQQLIELEQAVDFNTAVEMLQRLHYRLNKLVHYIPLWEVDDVIVIRKNIQGFPRSPVTPYQNVERWLVQPWYPTDLL